METSSNLGLIRHGALRKRESSGYLKANRLQKAGTTVRYKRFLADFPFTEAEHLGIAGRDPENYYVVQTQPISLHAACS